jgi:hypothetical protein
MPDRRPTPPPGKRERPASLLGSGFLVALGLAAVLLFGIGLGGGLRWHTHRLMLQLQGAVVGLAAGFLAGRLSAPRR